MTFFEQKGKLAGKNVKVKRDKKYLRWKIEEGGLFLFVYLSKKPRKIHFFVLTFVQKIRARKVSKNPTVSLPLPTFLASPWSDFEIPIFSEFSDPP